MANKITIYSMRKPISHNLNQELQWFGSSLGMFGIRDKDKSCFRVFIELLRNAKEGNSLTSDELAAKLKLSRGTVVHHIHRLEGSGMVVCEKKGYILRASRLKDLVAEIERDMKRTLESIKEIADEIDRRLR